MDKTDFKKTDKPFYTGKVGRFDYVDLPKMSFLSIVGKGDPNSSKTYASAIAALYGLSYGLKFYGKGHVDKDHVVPPLEGLWWADDMDSFTSRDKSNWRWKMMIRQPLWVSQANLNTVCDQAVMKNAKKKAAPTDETMLRSIVLEDFTEGPCVQTLHVGSYDDETAVLAELHEKYLPKSGFVMRGLHHEIYLSDPRKTAPEKLKTILRQPVTTI